MQSEVNAGIDLFTRKSGDWNIRGNGFSGALALHIEQANSMIL